MNRTDSTFRPTPPPRPSCSSNPSPCYPGAECRDMPEGPRCGRCPQGLVGDGKTCKPGRTCSQKPCAPGNYRHARTARNTFQRVIIPVITFHRRQVLRHGRRISMWSLSGRFCWRWSKMPSTRMWNEPLFSRCVHIKKYPTRTTKRIFWNKL